MRRRWYSSSEEILRHYARVMRRDYFSREAIGRKYHDLFATRSWGECRKANERLDKVQCRLVCSGVVRWGEHFDEMRSEVLITEPLNRSVDRPRTGRQIRLTSTTGRYKGYWSNCTKDISKSAAAGMSMNRRIISRTEGSRRRYWNICINDQDGILPFMAFD